MKKASEAREATRLALEEVRMACLRIEIIAARMRRTA